jgi:hypothetical protein
MVDLLPDHYTFTQTVTLPLPPSLKGGTGGRGSSVLRPNRRKTLGTRLGCEGRKARRSEAAERSSRKLFAYESFASLKRWESGYRSHSMAIGAANAGAPSA